MENLFAHSLVVSGLGMLLLFFALAILYALMYLMTKVLKDPASAPVRAEEEEPGVPGGDDAMCRAAAIAVALARAGQGVRPAGVPVTGESQGTGSVSPWWAFHHDRQLTRNPITRRTR